MKTVLGLDLGSETGWAAVTVRGLEANVVGVGAETFRPTRFESAGMRYIRFRAWLGTMLASVKPDVVAYEEVVRHAGVIAAQVYGGFVATLQTVLTDAGVEFMGVPVGTVKRLATGKGNASKEEVLRAAQKVPSMFTIDSEDAADALFVALAAVKQLGWRDQ